MLQYIIKLAISAALIVLISEISKRTTFVGALLASLPIVSYLGMIWLYVDTKDADKIAALSTDIFWLVLPSLPFFLVLPALLKRKIDFVPALLISTVVLFVCYAITMWALKTFGPAPTVPPSPAP